MPGGRHDNSIFTTLLSFLLNSAITIPMMMLIMLVQPVINSNDSVIWQATVATGNATDAGTNGTIFLTFRGTENSSDVHLTSLNGVLFQRGHVDIFKIYTDYIGELIDMTIVHVEMSSSFTYLKWQLNYFLLLNLNTSTEYGFHYGNYIPENSFGYGEITIRPNTILQLTNNTTVSSLMGSSIFSTQDLLSFYTSTINSQDFSSVFNVMDASEFASGAVMNGPTATAFNVVASSLIPDSFLLPTASALLPNQGASSSILFPTSDISFTPDVKTLIATTTALPDSTTDILTDIFEAKSGVSQILTFPTSLILSSCVCPTAEMDSSRMASVWRELTIDKKQLSTYKRKKTSAPDDRNSARAIGFVALFVLALPIAYIILIDLSNYRKFLPENGKKRRAAKKKRIERT